MVALLQATYVGAPMIYYGTELGMWSADDPEDRMPTWWHRKDQEIFNSYQSALQLRHAHPALRRGDYRVLETRNDAQVFAFERRLEDQRLVVVLNRSKGEATLGNDYLDGLQVIFSTDPAASTRRLPPLSAAVFGQYDGPEPSLLPLILQKK
jgi:glycosidase